MIEIRSEVPSFERDPIFEKSLERHHEKAKQTLEEFQIQMEDFNDLYGEVAVRKDKEYVADRENKFAENMDKQRERSKKLADIFEVIVDDQIELNEWLGSNAYAIKTSKYDDYRHGVDTVVEFDREEGISHLALAIDVTYGTSKISDKVNRIKKDIEYGKLTKIKYFESENMNFRGEINNIPRLVVGADIDSVKELMELVDQKNNKELSEHKVKIQTIEMIRMQLEAYRDYAGKKGFSDLEKVYDRHLKMITDIMAAQGIEEVGRYFKGDKLFQELKKQLSYLQE